MRLLDELMYDPRKFFGAVIGLFWVLPIVLVGLTGFTANAQNANQSTMSSHTTRSTCSNDFDSDDDGSHPDADDHRSCSTVNKQVTHQNTMQSNCGCQQSHSSNNRMTNSCDCRSSQPAVTHTSNNCTCQQTTPAVVHTPAPVPQTRVVERTRIVPQKTTIIREVPQSQPANNSASAAAAATSNAVVNVAAAQAPQVEAANTNYQTGTSSTATNATAGDSSASTNTVYQATPSTANVSYGKTLPNTGAGSVISLAGGATIFAALVHYVYHRRQI